MKKKFLLTLVGVVCALCCALGLVACENKELNYLKVLDAETGQYKSSLDIGTYSSDQLDEIKTKLSELKFIFEYYPDKSTEDADMSKVKTKYFYSDGEGGHFEGEGIPTTLQNNALYELNYYYEGHEPTTDHSDALCVNIQFFISNE